MFIVSYFQLSIDFKVFKIKCWRNCYCNQSHKKPISTTNYGLMIQFKICPFYCSLTKVSKIPQDSKSWRKVTLTSKCVLLIETSPETLVTTGPGFFASLSPSKMAMVSARASFTKCLIMSEFTGTPASTKSWRAPLLVPSTKKMKEFQSKYAGNMLAF